MGPQNEELAEGAGIGKDFAGRRRAIAPVDRRGEVAARQRFVPIREDRHDLAEWDRLGPLDGQAGRSGDCGWRGGRDVDVTRSDQVRAVAQENVDGDCFVAGN